MLSDISHTGKDQTGLFHSNMGYKTKATHEQFNKKQNKLIDTDIRMVVSRGEGDGEG